MPRPGPKPLDYTREEKLSRWEQFLRRNIVTIAICVPLAVIAVVAVVGHLAGIL